MNKSIEQNYKKKIKDYEKHSKLYYQKSSPIISDKEFDELKREIINLEKKYPSLKNKNSPSNIVGYKPCLLYTSPSPRDKRQSRMPSSA